MIGASILRPTESIIYVSNERISHAPDMEKREYLIYFNAVSAFRIFATTSIKAIA